MGTGIGKDTSEIGEATVVFEEAEKELPSKLTTEDESVIVTIVDDAPEPSIVQLPDQKETSTEETNTTLVLKPSDRKPKKVSSKVKSKLSSEQGDKTNTGKDTSEFGEATVVFEEPEKELPSKLATKYESVIVTTVANVPEPSIVQLPDQKELPTEDSKTSVVLKPSDQKPKKISSKVKSKLSSEQRDKTGIKKDTSEFDEATVVFEEAEKELPSKPTTEDGSRIVTIVNEAPEPIIVQLPDQKETPTEETNTTLVLKPSDRKPKKVSSKVKSKLSSEQGDKINTGKDTSEIGETMVVFEEPEKELPSKLATEYESVIVTTVANVPEPSILQLPDQKELPTEDSKTSVVT